MMSDPSSLVGAFTALLCLPVETRYILKVMHTVYMYVYMYVQM